MLCGVCNCQNADNATVCRSCGSSLTTGSATHQSTAGLPTGTKLRGGEFTVGKVLGQGGFGITYLGGDTTLGRSVAIKELFPQGCARQGTTVYPSGTVTADDFTVNKQKFLEEARVVAQFHHKGIVQVYSIFEENNTAYIVMEFVKGKTLEKLLDEKKGPLPEKEVVNYITQAADALGAVHEAKVLHRDIKPDNLMVTQDGRIVLVDFGTARAFASGKAKHMTRLLTPGYAPPEQWLQEARFGPFTDLYALGGTCYHLLTGQLPVQATDRLAGVELQSPHRVNHEVSQTVSDAVMWALEMKADQRPQSVEEFIKALTGDIATPRAADETKDTTRTHGDHNANPYADRIAQLADELKKPSAPFPPSAYDGRIAEINQKLALCNAYRVPQPNHCPGCGNESLEEVTGRFTGNCPVCRAGKLMKRRLDPDKCPICRTGHLDQQQLEQPVIFCPICRMKPLTEDRRKRLAILTETWWVCDHCKAELDLGVLKESAKLVRYEQDPFGLAAKYAGQGLPVSFWLSHAPQCKVARKCSSCAAAFYEFPDASMMLVKCPTDPHGIAAQTFGKCVPRQTWVRLAYNLSANVGNAGCPQCHAEFNFDQGGPTLKLLSCNAGQFGWADKLKGQVLPMSTWCLLSDRKSSCHPGFLCQRCSTEFDTEATGLRLVRSTAVVLSQSVGSDLSLTDWQRLGARVPTAAQEYALHGELANLETLKQQEELGFRQREQERRSELDAELAGLVQKAVLGGFTTVQTGTERLPLDRGETVCWNSPAGRLKQRSRQGYSYWDLDGDGTLFVTTQRVVFATPDGKRWQRLLSKMHTVRIEDLGSDQDVRVLVVGFDGLQKPIAFVVPTVTASTTVKDCSCSFTLAVEDLAELLQSRFGIR
jgi:serine/threonine protein kinase